MGNRQALGRRDVLRSAGAVGVGAVVAGTSGAQHAAASTGRAASSAPRTRGLSVRKESFGSLEDGQAVDRYVLTGGRGLEVAMLTYGATIHTIETPDRRGRRANIALGFDTIDDYVAKSPYFGSTIGRYGNRIAGATFTLDGKRYEIPANDGDNALHGGTKGFDKFVWDAEVVEERDRVGVRFSRVSPDGEMGFPGTLTVSATYTVSRRGELSVDYEASTDAPTVLNLTNHVYLNLAGAGRDAVYDHVLSLEADRYTPVDENLIPTGALDDVADTPFDFRISKPIGRDIRGDHEQLLLGRGYDHNLVLSRTAARGRHPFARVYEPSSGRRLTMTTDQPGVQFYTSNFLDGSLVGTGARTYRQGDALCLETQHFPDSPNQPDFPSTVLRPGKTFTSTTTWRFHC